MERKWTENQQLAITYHGCDTLVAAAAGSGKTAVLTERVIRMLTEGENPTDINRLLIVTFTKSAAEELKTRIADRLKSKLEENPTPLLRHQLSSLPNAQISTVHSFCYTLVKDNYSSLSLPAELRIADEAEMDLLLREEMERLMDDCYEKNTLVIEKIPHFEEICENFLRCKTDENLIRIFTAIYKTVLNSPKGLQLLKESTRNYECIVNDGFGKSIFQNYIFDTVNFAFSYYFDAYGELINKYSDNDSFTKKYRPALEEDAGLMHDCLLATKNKDAKCLENLICKYVPVSLRAVSGEAEFKIEAKKLKDNFKKILGDLKDYYGYSEDEIRCGAEKSKLILDGIFDFLSVLEQRLDEKKREKKVLDFSDLERYACKLLWNSEKEERTPLAETVSNGFDEILVDEYQDTNELQDRIFSSIGEGKRFMVGDIKQSVYGFRGALPKIFASYRKKFANANEGKTIFLSNNFRCAERIIDFTNEIFSNLFSDNEDIPYTQDDALIHSKIENEAGKEEEVEIVLFDSKSKSGDGEAEWVAEKISLLLKCGTNENGERYKPGDFAVLMRSTKSGSERFENELNIRGIPVHNTAEGNLFDSPEVELVICILCAVDNPLNDVYLAGAMKSPVFGFDIDEMMEISQHREEMSLYETVKLLAENGNEKCKNLTDRLSRYRHVSQGMPTDRFIDYLYRDTNLKSLLYACGSTSSSEAEAKCANLTLLYEYAKSFEQGSFKGLYNFIKYLKDIIAKGKTLGAAKAEDDNCVKILTVHKSKGLEFPVCFLCGCGKKKVPPKETNFDYSPKYGFGFKLKDESGFIINKYPMLSIINSDNKDKDFWEDGRVLYVAMTRARQRLFITAATDDPSNLYESTYLARPWKGQRLKSLAKNDITLLLSCLDSHKTNKPYKITVSPCFEENFDYVETEEAEKSDRKYNGELVQTFKERFEFVYPYEIITKLPKKVAISRLYPDLLDDDGESEIKHEIDASDFDFPMAETQAEKSAERGIATHVFMQFCDMQNAKKSVDDECERLINEGFMPKYYSQLIYRHELKRFFENEIYEKITNSPKVLREYRFNIGLPARHFTVENIEALSAETLFVQGVIDCAYENSDGTLTLLDYKTDRIKNTVQGIEEFKDRHRMQLMYYKLAIEKITQKKISSLLLYSFCLDKVIEL